MSGMKVITCRGTARELGAQAGEQLRDEIRMHVERWVAPEMRGPDARLTRLVDVGRAHLPHVLDELDAMADAAGVERWQLYHLNFPYFSRALAVDEAHDEGCTNVVFTDTPDGPVWGKNNDGEAPDKRRPACIKLLYPTDGLPVVMITHCGMVAVMDGMNAEGLCVGHSSVGSRFQQSDEHVGVRLWSYEAMRRCRTTGEFVRFMASRPTRGKGYAGVAVDRRGVTTAFEAPCPLFQVRRPSSPRGTYCTNCYREPAIAEADRRTPDGKADALARAAYLDRLLESDTALDAGAMQSLLRRHGDADGPGLCRHARTQIFHTEYSTIGLPAQGRLLHASGYPCASAYDEVSL